MFMKKGSHQNKKINNAGVSLVEIVVAIFILAVVTVSILQVFVYSIRLNARSRTRQQSTAAAQTVMEYFKAYPVETICKQFLGVAGESFKVNGTEGTPTTQIIWFSATGAPQGDVNLDINSPDIGKDISELLSDGTNANFRIQGIKYQNETFDVEVCLRSHFDQKTLIYHDFTEENSGAYVGDYGMDADALSRIADEVAEVWTMDESEKLPSSASTLTHSGSEVDLSKIDIVDRKLTCEIKKTDSDYVAEVSCVYTYKVDYYPYVVNGTGTDTYFHIDLKDYTYDNWDYISGNERKEIFRHPNVLENLTLYYYPAYGRGSALDIKGEDWIIIQNSLPHGVGEEAPKINCYVYKQRNPAISDNKVSYSELGYRLNLDLVGDGIYIYDDNLSTVLGSPGSTAMEPKVCYNGSQYPDLERRLHGIGHVARENRNYPGPNVTPSPIQERDRNNTMVNRRIMYEITVSVYGDGELTTGSDPSLETLSVLKGTIIQ